MSKPDKEAAELMEMIFMQAQMQFGAAAIKGRWFHDGDGCPGCDKKITGMKYKGKDTLSINAFIFREHGIVIAYFLCGKCGKKVINATTDTPLHGKIEETLKRSFLKHLGH
jgi:hypothetical protein